MTNRFVNYLVSKDIFGYNFKINYMGDDNFKTGVGAVWTIIVYAALLFNFWVLVSAFNDGSNQEEKSRFQIFDRFTAPAFNFNDYHTNIALGNLQGMTEDIARLRAYHVIGFCTEGQTRQECLDAPHTTSREIDMPQCEGAAL